MNKLIVAALILGGLLFLASGDATGHGGVYRGPGDTVPPVHGPGPGTGGPNNGGPVTPGPVGPGTPGGARGPVTPGGGPVAPGSGGAGPRGPVTGPGLGGRRRPSEGYEQWQFWWESNKDRYLDLRRRLGENTIQTGSAGFLTGMGRKEAAALSRRPSAEEVNQTILPLLRSVLSENDADIVDSAVLAIGRTVRPDSAALALEDIKQVLGSQDTTPQQSAILALGVLGSRDAVPWLVEIMNDTPAGRKLLRLPGATKSLQRSFAAIALGFIGSPETVKSLQECIDNNNNNSEIDLRACAILALGLFQEGKDDIVQYLVGLLKDRDMDHTTRAQIPIALGRLGEPAALAVPQLLKEVKSKTTDIRVQESCVIALGLLGNPEDREILKALYDLIEEGRNEQARHFAFIALAQIGGRAAEDPDAHQELLDQLNRFLMQELASPKIQTHKPWAALALALLGRGYSETSHARAQIAAKVLEAFEASNNAHHQSAFAISLGLLNATSRGEAIYQRLLDTNDTSLKGYLAVSLGMMRYTRSLETLRNLVLDNRDEKMRLQVATALGLMADVEAVGLLIDGLRTAKALAVVSSMAKALGLIGDKNAIASLEEIIGDKKATGCARGFACVAVGLIGEKSDLPWNEPLSANANYRTVLPSLYEIFDIL